MAQSCGVMKPDLSLLHYYEAENTQMLKWRMSSMHRKEANTHDQQDPPPLLFSIPPNVSSVQPEQVQRCSLFLPTWGDEADKIGLKLPCPLGVISGLFFGKRDIRVNKFYVDIKGSTLNMDGLTHIIARSNEMNWSLRLDACVFPFMSVYVIGGYTRQHADTNMDVNVNDRIFQRNSLLQKDFGLNIDFEGLIYGGGITLVSGYKSYFALFDINYTRSDQHGDLGYNIKLDDHVQALVCSARIGWRRRLGAKMLNLWFGETYWGTSSTIKGNLHIPFLGTARFGVREFIKKPFSTHVGAYIEISERFRFLMDVGTNFSGLISINPLFIYRF